MKVGRGASNAPPKQKAESRKAKPGRPRLSAEEKLERKKRLAESLIIRVRVEGKPPHEAWYDTHPRSTASRQTASRETQRLIKWYRKEFPLSIDTALYLARIDYGTYCGHIKRLLGATRYYRGEPTDLPDWDARRRGLKQLMIGLGLATPYGFRSGPRAIGGALEKEPIAMEGAGETGMDFEVDVPRRLRAEAIIYRHYAERKRFSDCWKELCPSSDANPRSAAKKAQADIAWFKARCFQSLEQKLVANGLDNETVLEGITEMLSARSVFRGALTDDPDWRVRSQGRDLLLVIHGYRHPSGRRHDRVISLIDTVGPRAMDELVGVN